MGSSLAPAHEPRCVGRAVFDPDCVEVPTGSGGPCPPVHGSGIREAQPELAAPGVLVRLPAKSPAASSGDRFSKCLSKTVSPDHYSLKKNIFISPFSCAVAYRSTLGEMLRAQKVEDIDGFIAGLNEFFEHKGGKTA